MHFCEEKNWQILPINISCFPPHWKADHDYDKCKCQCWQNPLIVYNWNWRTMKWMRHSKLAKRKRNWSSTIAILINKMTSVFIWFLFQINFYSIEKYAQKSMTFWGDFSLNLFLDSSFSPYLLHLLTLLIGSIIFFFFFFFEFIFG